MHPNETTINDYVDGTLDAGERKATEHHLNACAPCRRLADDLGAVRRAAAALGLRVPPADGWSRIERAILEERSTATRGATAKVPYWLAAAAAVVLLATVAGLRFAPFARRAASPAPPVPTAIAAGDVDQSVETEMRQAAYHYENAIKGLEQIAGNERSALDPATAATLQNNLAVIDLAIGESRTAVSTDPDNEPAQQSLIENFRTKISLLQDTVALISEMRRINDAGAAQVVSGLEQPR
jgi:hypothetical protein